MIGRVEQDTHLFVSTILDMVRRLEIFEKAPLPDGAAMLSLSSMN